MNHHPIKKILGLLSLYVVIIFGIFFIQFKDEASLFKSFGTIQLRLTEKKDAKNKSSTLKNNFQVFTKSLLFYSNEDSAVSLVSKNQKKITLILKSWEKISNTAFNLIFSDDIILNFESKDDETSIKVILPDDNTLLSLPYKTLSPFKVTKAEKKQIILESTKYKKVLQAGNINDNFIDFNKNSLFARVSPYVEKESFSFSILENQLFTARENFTKLSSDFRLKLLNEYKTIPSSESTNEKIIAAYVAEMAAQNKYADAIKNIPDVFAKGSKRTYFTAPFFNTLLKMNDILVQELENLKYSMNYSLDKKTLTVFEHDNFPLFFLTQKIGTANAILKLPAQLIKQDNNQTIEQNTEQNLVENTSSYPSFNQAIGIIDLYTRILPLQPSSAAFLEPVLAKCIEVIEKNCSYTNNTLHIELTNHTISQIALAKAGRVLIQYASIKEQKYLETAGFLILNLAIQNTNDLLILGELYPFVVPENLYYPHFQLIAYEEKIPVWAWTSSPEIQYKHTENKTISISTKFLENQSHYIILNGINPFKQIEIYGLKYRTDPRFETYNSSGYVYQEKNKRLFLKNRHKKSTEVIKLFYSQSIPKTKDAIEQAEDESIDTETTLNENTAQ